MESEKIIPGQIVHSRAGRDVDGYFIIVGIIDHEYVLISDGKLRRIEKPKKKKVKHLVFHNLVANDIKNRIETGAKITNADIRNSLESMDLINQSNNKEV